MGIDIFGQVTNGFLEMRGKLKQITSLILTEYSIAGDAYDGGKMLRRAYADEKEDWSIRKEVSELCWCFSSITEPDCFSRDRTRIVETTSVSAWYI